MSNKADRQPPEKVYGRLPGEPETSALLDGALSPNVSVDGAQPMVGTGDTHTKLLKVRCYCGSIVGELWKNNRSTRTGLPPFWSLVALIIEDAETRPITVRHIENIVSPGASLVTDCPAHGRRVIAGSGLLKAGYKAESRYAAGVNKISAFVIPRG